MNSLSWEFLHAWIPINCPRCDYSFEVQMLDVLCQVWRWCPCCRVHIRLIEPAGEVSGALRDVSYAWRRLTER